MPAMAGSVTEAQSHDEGTYMYRCGRNATRVREEQGFRTKVLLGTWKDEWAQEYDGGMSSRLWRILWHMNVVTN